MILIYLVELCDLLKNDKDLSAWLTKDGLHLQVHHGGGAVTVKNYNLCSLHAAPVSPFRTDIKGIRDEFRSKQQK